VLAADNNQDKTEHNMFYKPAPFVISSDLCFDKDKLHGNHQSFFTW